jgi:Rv2632c-like/Domain of unknown function (DUF1918)
VNVNTGDRIEVTSNVLGVPPRYGSVLEARSSAWLRVRWDDGNETMFAPAGNCRVVSPDEDDSDGVVTLGCHVDVTLVEEDDECRATASVVTTRGLLRADGVARRNPSDRQIPMIGEELAFGRALGALSEQLITAAAAHIALPPSDREHLVS